MKVTWVSDFLMDDLAALLASAKEKGTVAVSLTTYKTVRGYDNGVVKTGKDGLTVVVNAGGHSQYSLDSLAFMMTGTQTGLELGSLLMHAEAGVAHAVVEQGAARALAATEGAVTKIAFVYAGVSAWSQAIEFARHLQQQGQTVILVSCDCNDEREARSVADLGFSHFVFTDECGAHQTMVEILQAVIANW